MNFQYQYFEKEFEKSKKELKKAWKQGNIYKTLCYLRYLTCFYYTINYTLSDEELEEITQDISFKLLGETRIERTDDNTVIFYDGFGLATRGLANIYVKALCELGFQIVWVMYEWASDFEEIQNKFAKENNVQFIKVAAENILERMKKLQGIVQDVSPKYIFIYTLPDDVTGIGTFSTVKGEAVRFLVDLTDHAFWLGKCASDYVIGFRNVGYNVAIKYRKFNEDQVVLLPYYPEKRENYSFEGMPFDIKKHEFVFSGGSVYKIEGSQLYENMVRYILDKYPEIYFVYAGDGKSEKLDQIKRSYAERFFQINERKDLDQIMKNAKFYLSTYPMFGALMTQYAIQNNCIPVSLCNMENPLANPTTLVIHPEKADYFLPSFDETCAFIDRMMKDSSYYRFIKNDLADQVISEKEFREELESIMLHGTSKFQGYKEEIDIQSFLNIYKKRASKEIYVKTIYNSRNKWVYRRHLLIWLRKKLKI